MSRRLRIAVSASFAVVVFVLLLLWLRSRSFIDVAGVTLPANHVFFATSSRGELELTFEETPSNSVDDDGNRFGVQSLDMSQMFEQYPMRLPFKFAWTNTPHGFRATTPIWLWMLLATLAALAPWRQALWSNLRRFSLRTLLLTTTLIAIMLGLFVWLA